MTPAGVALAAAALRLAGLFAAWPVEDDGGVHARLLWGARAGVSVAGKPLPGRTAAEVEQYVRSLSAQLRVPPVDAAVEKATGRIVAEREGAELDAEATTAAVMAAGEGEDVPVRFRGLAPRLRASDIRRLRRVGGSFATTVGGSRERRENVRLAARCVNNSLIPPGGTFSFLAEVGPVTYERGFVDAPVIVGDEFVSGPGGGICQVSTTVYNAALSAGLHVVERHPHARPVGYVPEGMDATVASWGLDLKIRNGFEHPVMLVIESSEDQVVARFLFPAEP